MPLYTIFILSLIQGITEFLPVSSSGHLIFIHFINEGEGAIYNCETNKLIDIAVHVGTLLSVLVYFHKDVIKMLFGLKDTISGNIKSDESRLLQFVIIGTIPVVIAGFIIYEISPSFLCSIEVVAWTTLIFGILLWIVDKYKPSTDNLDKMTYGKAFIIGLFQILSLVPGTSRSGITMTAARLLNFDRVSSAKFSLLLSMAAISGAGILTSMDIIEQQNIEFTYDIITAVFLSFISGLVAISLMIKWLSKYSFTPFVLYRIALGVILLAIIYV